MKWNHLLLQLASLSVSSTHQATDTSCHMKASKVTGYFDPNAETVWIIGPDTCPATAMHDNIRATINRLLSQTPDSMSALRVITACGRLWISLHGRLGKEAAFVFFSYTDGIFVTRRFTTKAIRAVASWWVDSWWSCCHMQLLNDGGFCLVSYIDGILCLKRQVGLHRPIPQNIVRHFGP